MATYAIGDVQGCFTALSRLLEQINFSVTYDTLWFAGDLVNRGPDSLKTLRFIKNLGNSVKVVLGNHDIHLLGLVMEKRKLSKGDTLQTLLQADDLLSLIDWLRQQPLLIYDAQLNFCMTHAGVPHIWSLQQAISYAAEVEIFFRSENLFQKIAGVFGSEPNIWCNDLIGVDRIRVIVNYFTRMRFIDIKGTLELKEKSSNIVDKLFQPWFEYDNLLPKATKILFGHWAALQGKTTKSNVFALDTGCVWGGQLTALRLEDLKLFQVACDC